MGDAIDEIFMGIVFEVFATVGELAT